MIRASRSARGAAAALLLLVAPALAGCGLGEIRDQSLGARCGDIMQRAFPGGDIKVTNSGATHDDTASVAAMIATATGVRRDVPAKGVLDRNVAVQCRFEDGILTGFRWTHGPLLH